MKKWLLIAGMLFAQSATAQQLEFVMHYPPGGGSDKHVSVLGKILLDKGIENKKVFFKTCAEALEYSNKNKDAVLVSVNSDLRSEPTGICPGVDIYINLKFLATLSDSEFMLCTTPSRPDITLKTLQDSQTPIVIGSPTSDINWKTMQLLKKYSKLNIQILPFKGAGDLKTAVVSGTVQMFYGGTVAKQMVTDGAKCLASSKKDNWAKAPFIGSLITQANFPETSLQAIAFSNNQLSPKIATALRDAVNSNDFAEQLVTMGLTPASVSQRFTQDKAQTALRKLDELYKTIE